MASRYIVGFLAQHPMIWPDREWAEMGNLKTPEPAMKVFFDLVQARNCLPTYEELVDYACDQWREWISSLKSDRATGLKARLVRNFYPSGIDSLHAWALMVETGKFAVCYVDSFEDATSKTDLTVVTNSGESIKVALRIDSPGAQEWSAHKAQYRGVAPAGTFDIRLPMERPRRPGNKRWYEIHDFADVIRLADKSVTSSVFEIPQLSLFEDDIR